jgi:NADPH:quinone reductase-like Zn-dependent oxidoreductase
VHSLKPDRIIDYETDDFTKNVGLFDFVFDAVGKSSYGVCKKLLTPQGTYYSTELGAGGQNPLLALWFSITGSHRVIFPIPKINKENTEYIKKLVESGAYKPLIDKTYSIEEIVEATKYVEQGQKVGNVLIKIN